MLVLHAELSMFMQKCPSTKLTANQLRDGLKSHGLPVDGDKTALVDRYAAASLNGKCRIASGNSATDLLLDEFSSCGVA